MPPGAATHGNRCQTVAGRTHPWRVTRQRRRHFRRGVLEITEPGTGTTERLDLSEALRRLNIPSVSIALIEGDKLIWGGAYGHAWAHILYQAASLSKLV